MQNFIKILAAMLALVMVFGALACKTTDNPAGSTPEPAKSGEPTGSNGSFTGDKYVSDKNSTIKTAEFPSNYTPVPYDKFETAFKAIVNNEITTASTYEDVAKAFGDDGIRLDGMAYEGYAYYGWFSDKDFQSDNKVGVTITFKSVGGKLTYYAYTGVGITADEVR